MTEPRICSDCGKPKPPSDYYRNKARCKLCLSIAAAEYYMANSARILADKRSRYAEAGSGRWIRLVVMRYCLDDSVLHRPMYNAPCHFSRSSFIETLAAGYWPDRSLWEFALVYRGAVTRWRVSGRCILEVDSGRVAEASFGAGEHAKVTLVDAAIAAKGR